MASILDPLMEEWLVAGRLRPQSQRAYRGHLASFAAWAQERGISLLGVQEHDLAQYSLDLRQRGLTGATVDAMFTPIRGFYKWLVLVGHLERNPATRTERFRTRGGKRDALTLQELRALVAAATDPTDRAVVLLTIVNGLGGDEIAGLTVADLCETGGDYHLKLPGDRTTPLPQLVHVPLLRAVGYRKRGPLLLNEWNNPLTNANIRRITRRAARNARISIPVSQVTLTASMRSVLVNEPISLAAVLQGIGFGTYTNLANRARNAPKAPQHIAHRMALLLRPDADSTDALLAHADSLSAHHGLPPAARVMVAGAAFERHLRELAVACGGIEPDHDKTSIMQLAGRLVAKRTIPERDNAACVPIAAARDWAAHGWFDMVTDDLADRVVAEMRRIVTDHPLVDPNYGRHSAD